MNFQHFKKTAESDFNSASEIENSWQYAALW